MQRREPAGVQLLREVRRGAKRFGFLGGDSVGSGRCTYRSGRIGTGGRFARARRRAQDGHRAVRRHQGLDRDDGGTRPGAGARDHRPGTEADDRRGRIATTATSCNRPATASSPCSARRVAHEDHPQRALYAALRMQEELKRYSARWREVGNLPIEGRVGVNTGEVVVRSISTGAGQTEYTPIGHTTNLASRMQALAPTGSIAISEQTRKLVRGLLRLKPLGPTRVKGVTEPVNVYEVTGLGPLRTRLQRSAGRGLTKFVGREREMEALKPPPSKPGRDTDRSSRRWPRRAPASRGCSSSSRPRISRAGWCWRPFRSRTAKHRPICRCIDLLHGYFKIAGEDDRAHAAREGHRQRPDSRPCAGRHAAVPVQLARHRRGRGSAGADGRAVEEAAHARGDQADSAARVAQSAADGDLRGPALDRRGDPGVPESARRLDSAPRRSCCW